MNSELKNGDFGSILPALCSPAMRAPLVSLFMVLCLWIPVGVHAEFSVVRDGRPTACIVVTPTTDPPVPAKGTSKKGPESDEALAVRTLGEWIKKIADAELPVVGSPLEGLAPIYVGRAAVAAGLSLDDVVHPGREGLRIQAGDQRVLIAGQSEGATLKAVCRFLEQLGCRYFMDGPLGEVFPRAQTLTVRALDLAEKPGLLWRNPKGPSWNARLWKAWNGGGGTAFGHSHAWGNYVKPTEFEKHPEFFALGADGQRKKGGWLCTSNPGLREHFISGVLRAIEDGTQNPSLSPTDGRAYCQCSPCRAQDDPRSVEPSSGTVSVTNRYVDFFNAIGLRVGKSQPNAVLSFYCYADYTQPPTVREKLSPNLCAMIAPIRYCRLHPLGHPGCPSRQQQVEMVGGWSGVASRIGYYNYLYNLADATLPMFKYSACAQEFPYLAERGLSYMTLEVLSNWHIYGPQIYLALRLAYDPFADAAALMDDYWLHFYGPAAAPHMRAYWMGIDSAQQQLPTHAGSFFGLSQIYTPEFLVQCEEHLRRAAEAAKINPIYAQRVAMHADGLRVARAYRTICESMVSGDFARSKLEFERIEAILQPLMEQGLANREYGTNYLHRFLKAQIVQGAEAVAAAVPGSKPVVLPDKWRFHWDEDDSGLQKGFHLDGFDDSSWREAATYSTTLDAQGLEKPAVLWYRTTLDLPPGGERRSLFFTEVDGRAEVFVNGLRIEIPERYQSIRKPTSAGAADSPPRRDGATKPRAPFELDVTAALRAKKNTVVVRVDHTQITELSLGGILRPVLLISKTP